MKKSIIAFGMAVLAFTACNTKKESELKITLPDTTLNGTYIQVLDFAAAKGSAAVDSILVNGNEATFKMAPDTNRLFLLRSKTFMGLYIPELGKQTINVVPTKEQGKLFVASETPLNKALFDVLETESQARKAFVDVVEKAKADGSIKDPAVSDKLNEEYAGLAENATRRYKEAYAANKLNAAAPFFLLNFTHSLSLSELDSLINVGGEAVKNNQKVAAVRATLVKADMTSEGKMFTDLQGVNPSDTTQVRKLSDYVGKGKYVVVDFWASWCGPCKAEMPHLKEAYAKYHKKGLEVVGFVVWDKIENHLKAAEELKLPWPQIFNSEESVPATYGIDGIPTVILFDKDGTIISRKLRGEALLAKLAELYK